ALAVLTLVHINEINHNDAAQVTQADLADNLPDRVDVGFDDGVFQPRGLAHIFACIHVNGHQRLSLVDHDVSTALEPHFRLERLVDFFRNIKLLEQRSFFGIELYALHQRRLEAAYKAQNSLVLLLAVNHDGRKAHSHLIAQNPLYQI